MAKRPAARRASVKRSARKRTKSRRSGKRPSLGAKSSSRGRRASSQARVRRTKRTKATAPKRRAGAATAKAARKAPKTTTRPFGPPPPPGTGTRTKVPQLGRVRRTLEEIVPTPPSSLNLDRHASAARTGRIELADALQKNPGITPAITGGDVDANWQQAYFAGDEAPGGDNPTPDQEVVDDIGKALGVQYEDNEELKSTDKVVQRDKHRWELDPASAEDYKERK